MHASAALDLLAKIIPVLTTRQATAAAQCFRLINPATNILGSSFAPAVIATRPVSRHGACASTMT